MSHDQNLSRKQPLTAEQWLLRAIDGLLALQSTFIADGYQRDSTLISGLETALSQINEAAVLLRSETRERTPAEIGRDIKRALEPQSAGGAIVPTREDFIQVNDTLDVAECCVHDQIKNPLERDATKAGLQRVRELALSALRSAATPTEIARLREIEHLAWHLLDDSAEDAQTGEVTISPLREDYDKLSALLPEGHPESNAPDRGNDGTSA